MVVTIGYEAIWLVWSRFTVLVKYQWPISLWNRMYPVDSLKWKPKLFRVF